MSNLSQNLNSETSETYHHFLKTIPLFSEIEEHSLEALLKNATLRTFKKGKILFFSGDHVEYIHINQDGWFKLFRETRDGHESVLTILSKGDVIGDAACLHEADYSYSCEIVQDAKMLQIPISYIHNMSLACEKHKALSNKLLERYIYDHNQRCLEVEHLTTMTSAQRIGCFLLKHCNDQEQDGITIHLPIDKYLLARRLGMTPETFSRALNQLSALGVETSKSEIKINNKEQLRNHVCHCCSALAQDCDFLQDDFDV